MPDIALALSPLAHVLSPGRYGRALPEGHEILWGSIERGALRGGVTSEADPSRRTPVAV